MIRRALLALPCGMLVLVAGFGGVNQTSGKRVSVQIEVTTYTFPSTVRHVHSLSLTCTPTAGSLPLAARVCRDIGRHPAAMLDPPKPRWTCSGAVGGPTLTVTTRFRGATHTFSGQPGCDWPVGPTLEVYWAASQHNEQELARVEPTLRCEEDATLLAHPTPGASAVACAHSLWTPRSEELIRLAERTPTLAVLQPAHLFPHDIGAADCTIPAGGIVAGQTLAGLCGVTMKNVWSTATVSFTEDWPKGDGKTARHIWHITIRGTHVLAVSQSGPVPPQLRR